MGQHARLSASQTSMWTGCPGSLAMQDLIPAEDRNISSDFARLGTCAHALIERVLGEGLRPEDYRGRIIVIVGDDEGTSILKKNAKAPKDPSTWWCEVDDDMIEATDVMVSYVRRRLAELFGHEDTKLAVEKKQLRLETRLTILKDRDDSFGTGDVAIDAWPELLEIVDYKHGQGVMVEAPGNKQLRSYALGNAELDGWDHERYLCTVCQPRKAHSEGPVRSDREMTRQELLDFRTWLSAGADRVDEADNLAGMQSDGVDVPDALMEAGLLAAGDHCRWCDAKYNRALDRACPAIRKAAEDTALIDFDDDPDKDVGREVPRDPEELGRLLRGVPVADMFLREIEASAQKLAMAGTRVPGHKLVRGKSPGRAFIRTREDGDEVVPVTEEWLKERLVADFDADPDRIMNPPKPATLKTGPQVEKTLPSKRRKEFSDALLFSQPGKITLVREEDPRPEVEFDPAADFAEDEEGRDDE